MNPTPKVGAGQSAPLANGHADGRGVAPDQRFRRGHPCPICHGTDDDDRGEGRRCFGFLSGDGSHAHCSRQEHAGQAPYNAASRTFAHRMKGPCKCGQTHAPADPKPRKAKGEIVATYDYFDGDGKLLHQTVRFKPKDFRQRRPDGKGGWAWDLKGVATVLYRAAELREADPADPVLFNEGEKGTEAVRRAGFVGTNSPMGAGKWRDRYAPEFRGRDVAILPDADGPGRMHADQVARSLVPVARSVRIVELPGIPEGGDAHDYFAAGGTAADLRRLLAATPPIRDGATAPCTDLGNAERMARRHGHLIRFCPHWNKWVAWDGRRWAIDWRATVYRLAKETVRDIYREAADTDSDARRKELGEWAQASESLPRVNAMVTLCAKEEGIPIGHDELDRDHWLLNCGNGTLDLRTGVLRDPRRGDLITRLCPTDYVPSAPCPLWEETLRVVFADNQPLIRFWQRLYGMMLTGDVSEQILPIAYGKGANGKSTVIGAFMDVIGPDYAMKAAPDFLMVKRHEAHPTDRADLFGKRMVAAVETGEGCRINETLVKELTGSDKIRARRMREDFWEFHPTHKLLLCTNHKPEVRGTDHAIWRRFCLVPFTVTIPKASQVRNLAGRLVADEARGILAWAVRGCLDWRLNGLEPPAEVCAATEQYRQEEDVLSAFLADRCRTFPGESGSSVRSKSSSLLAAFNDWAKSHGTATLTQRRFGEAMAEKGFAKTTSNGTWYLGVALQQTAAPDPDGPTRKDLE